MAKASKLADLFRSAFDKANKEKADLTNKLNDLLEQGRKIEEQVAAVKKELAEADENIAAAVKAAGKDFGISLEVDAGKGRGRPRICGAMQRSLSSPTWMAMVHRRSW